MGWEWGKIDFPPEANSRDLVHSFCSGALSLQKKKRNRILPLNGALLVMLIYFSHFVPFFPSFFFPFFRFFFPFLSSSPFFFFGAPLVTLGDEVPKGPPPGYAPGVSQGQPVVKLLNNGLFQSSVAVRNNPYQSVTQCWNQRSHRGHPG